MIGSYQVVYKNPSGVITQIWRDLDFISLEYARSVNNIGSMTLVIPDDGYSDDLFQRDYRAEIWRSIDGRAGYLETGTFWLLRSAVKVWDEQYRILWQLQFADTNDILKRRIVAYTRQTAFADKTIEELGAGFTDLYADNMMKAYMSDNYGSTATNTDRDLSAYLTIEAKTTQGPQIEKQAAFREVIAVLQEIANDSEANGTSLYFELIGDQDGQLLFVTRIGHLNTDHSYTSNAPVLFGPSFNNLTDINLAFDYSEEATVAFVGGADNGAARITSTITDETRIALSPYNRIEVFHDCRDFSEPTVLVEEGNTKLQQLVPKARVSGNTLDTPSAIYGREYQYGDLVTAIVDTYQIDCHVSAIRVSVSGGVEDIQAVLKGSTNI